MLSKLSKLNELNELIGGQVKNYEYALDYIKEATESRKQLKAIISRAVLAYKKEPSRQIYKENAQSFYQLTGGRADWDANKRAMLKSQCDSIPEGHNDTVFNAIETVVSMAMGGAGQFECLPMDKWQDEDRELVDRQEMYLDYNYRNNKLDAIAPETVRKLFMQGQFNYHIKPTKDAGVYKISLIDAYKMLFDPRRSKTNRERFIGYTEVVPWSAVKDSVYKEGKNYKLKTINNVDAYLNEIRNWTSPATGGEVWSNELSADLDTFYSIYNLPNTKGSQVVKDGKTLPIGEGGYKGEDVELAYLWDIENRVYLRVVNRRFIISAEENPLQRTIKITSYDGIKNTKEVDKVKVEIDSPIVHRGLIDADWETYPISPLWYCLDEFDKLCAKESVLEHNFSIMAPITFLANSYDAEILANLSQIAGQIAEGTSATMGVMNKSHDMSPIVSSIQRSEERIKRMLGATDQYELMNLMNNRATGAEVSMANAAVSQRLNIALAKLETGYIELMDKILKMNVIFNTDSDYLFPYKSGVGVISDKEILATTITDCRLKSRIKVEQKEQSQNALMVLQTITALAQSGAIDIKRAFGILLPRIMQGTLNRREAEAMIDDSIKMTPEKLERIIQKEKKTAIEESKRSPLDGVELDPETMDILEQMGEQAGVRQGNQASGISNTTDGASLVPNSGNPEQGAIANQVGATPNSDMTPARRSI